jgi:amino acid transporter
MVLWLAGGLIALTGALCYGELGSAMPRAGGEYVYLAEAYGSLAGFLSGWTWTSLTRCHPERAVESNRLAVEH